MTDPLDDSWGGTLGGLPGQTRRPAGLPPDEGRTPWDRSGPGDAPLPYLTFGDLVWTTLKTLLGRALVVGPIGLIFLIPAFALDLALVHVTRGLLGDLGGGQASELFERLLLSGGFSLEGILSNPATPTLGAALGCSLLEVLIRTAFKYASQAAIVFVTIEHLAGRRATIADGLGKVAGRLLPVLATAFLTTLLVSLGKAVCLVPGLIALSALFVAVPVTMTERLGPLASLGRSSALTAGNRYTIFLAWAGFSVCLGICWLAASILSAGILGGHEAIAPGSSIAQLISFGYELLEAMVLSLLSAVVYVRLRGLRDGLDAAALAEVFR